MGLAVAEALAKRGNWQLHLLDLNEKRGNEAASNLGKSKTSSKSRKACSLLATWYTR